MANLNFVIQAQEQTQWCWSACTVSIAKYFDANSDWTQCSLVNAELGRNDCCNNGNSWRCNKPWSFDRPLVRVGHLRAVRAGTVSFNLTNEEISRLNCPVGVRIGWFGGGGHFVVISGTDTATNFVTVKDPWGGATKNMPYNILLNNYSNAGRWTHTYRIE